MEEEALSRKNVSYISMIAGVLIALVSLLADLIGIGSYPGLNIVQYLGLLLGLAFIIMGYLLYRTPRKDKEPKAK